MVALSALGTQLIGHQPTGGAILYTADPEAIQADTGPFNITIGSAPTINAPHSAWNDVTFAWGWNCQVNGNAVAAGKPVLTYNLESGFWDVGKGKLGSESHHNFNDAAGASHRVFSYWLPWDGGTGSIVTHKVDAISWEKFSAGQQLYFNLTGSAPIIGIYNSGLIQSENNNVAFLQQKNAANNAFLNLPYITSQNKLAIGQPVTATGGPIAGAGEFALQLSPGTMADNQGVLAMTFPAVTGSVTGFSVAGQASDKLASSIRNSHSSGSGNAYLAINVANAGSGDPMIGLRVEAGTGWLVGVDNSDSDKFKIGTGDPASGGVGGATALTIDSGLMVSFGLPAQKPSYTVATLPSVATYVRCDLYVADGTSNKRLAISDGTNWRFPDGAIVS